MGTKMTRTRPRKQNNKRVRGTKSCVFAAPPAGVGPGLCFTFGSALIVIRQRPMNSPRGVLQMSILVVTYYLLFVAIALVVCIILRTWEHGETGD